MRASKGFSNGINEMLFIASFQKNMAKNLEDGAAQKYLEKAKQTRRHDFESARSFLELRGQHLELLPELRRSFQLLFQLQPQLRVLHLELLDLLRLGLHQLFDLKISSKRFFVALASHKPKLDGFDP